MVGVRTVSRRSFLGLCAGSAIELLALRPSPTSAAMLPPRGESIRQKTAEEILAQRPFAHTDESPFQPNEPWPPAPGEEPSEAQVADILDEFLEAEFPDDVATRTKARELFDDPLARENIPSPSLRAAVVGLWRTSAGPGINYILHDGLDDGRPKVRAVVFDESVFASDTARVAQVIGFGGVEGKQRQSTISVHPRFRAERFTHFINIMAHECLHQDGVLTNLEEIICTLIEMTIALELLSRHENLLAKGTDLGARVGRAAMLRLNSGPPHRLGLYENATGRPIFPRSSGTALSLWEARTNKSDLVETPGHALLAKYLEPFRYPENPPAPADTFSMDLVNWLDQNAASLGPEQLLAAARALKLEIPE